MKRLGLLLFALFETVAEKRVSLDYTAEIISSVQRFLHSSCTFLIFSAEELEHESIKLFVQLEKLMTTKRVLTATANLRAFNSSMEKFKCHGNIPLYVLVSSDVSVRENLVQLSNSTSLTAAFWLLFLNTDSLLEEFFTDINVPFDCEFLVAKQENAQLVVLTEVFRVSSTSPLQMYRFGNWTPLQGFKWCGLQFYKRRNSLNGYAIRAGYKYGDAIHIDEIEGKDADLINGLRIYFSKVWLLLEELMNFTTEYHRPSDNNWGALAKNGSWNGMIGMILRKEIDVAVDAYLITESRIKIIDFMNPLLSVRSRLFIRRPDSKEYKWTAFLDPFSFDLWLAVTITLFTLSGTLSGMYYIGRRYCGVDVVGEMSCGLVDSLYYVFGSFCQKGHHITPSSGSCRTVYVTSYFIGVILLAAYSASLISHLTHQRVVLPFTTFQGLLDVGTYKLGVIDQSAQLNYFDNSTDLLLQRIYKTLILPHKKDLPKSEATGLKRICEDPAYTFMTPSDTPLSRYNNFKCKMLEIPNAAIPGSVTMPMARKHPFLGLINHSLQSLRISGILNRLYKSTWPRSVENLKTPWTSVNIEEVTPIFSLLALGFVMAVFIIVLEFGTKCFQVLLAEKRHARKRTRLNMYPNSKRSNYWHTGSFSLRDL